MDRTKELCGSRAICLDLTENDPKGLYGERLSFQTFLHQKLIFPTWQVFRLPNITDCMHSLSTLRKTGLESQFHLLPCRKLPTLLTHKKENRKNKWLYFHTPNHPHDKVKTAAFGSEDRADWSAAWQLLLEQAGHCRERGCKGATMEDKYCKRTTRSSSSWAPSPWRCSVGSADTCSPRFEGNLCGTELVPELSLLLSPPATSGPSLSLPLLEPSGPGIWCGCVCVCV